MVVDPDLDVLDSLQRIGASERCDQLLLAPRGQVYAQIKRWQPSLVVVCMGSEDLDGYQLLTLLTVNPDTRRIPVLVRMTPENREDREADNGGSSPFWLDLPAART
jgi:CheY-like chemotaxis protein